MSSFNQLEHGWLEAGVADLNGNRVETAIQRLKREIAHRGPSVETYRVLAMAWTRCRRPAKAIEVLLQALLLAPQDSQLLTEYANICAAYGWPPEPLHGRWSAIATDLDPQGPYGSLTPAAAISRAAHLQSAGRLGPALEWCLKAVVLAPDDHLHPARAADLLLRTGRTVEALHLLRRAVTLSPSVATFQQIGGLCQELHDFAAAQEAYQRALALEPDYIPALCAVGHLLQDEGKLDEGNVFLRKAYQLKPDPLVRIVMETALPPLYESCEDLQSRRRGLMESLEQLCSDGVVVDPTERAIPTNFYIPYHGLNDRSLAEKVGRIYRPRDNHVCAIRPGASHRKIRVGFLSKFFCRHTIGRLNLGTVQKLSRERFEVVVLSARRPDDPFAHEFVTAADNYVTLSDQLASALQQIRQLELDVLFFTDVGMDPFTYSLAFARSAPMQCVTWGHPATTGSPTMDFFISSDRLEIPAAQEHYTEKLVRLPDLAVYYPRPVMPTNAPGREHFGFSADDHLYGCPQTLFKFHPAFDEILDNILRRDPRARVVCIEGRHTHWTDRLRNRLARRLGDATERIHFLPRLSWQEFMGVTHFVDVLLDPIHFGGGNTSYEALALGTPVVTLPGDFLRSRITLALYQRMGMETCVVNCPDQYVETALMLGTNAEYRQSVRAQIREVSQVLFEEVKGIRQLEQFWDQSVSELSPAD